MPRPTAPEVPPALDAVVARAMAKDPGQRYADADALAAAVRGATRVPSAATTRRWRAPRRAWRVAGRILSPVILLLALLCFGSGFLTVSCVPGGYGRAAPNGTTTYTGGDLATGSAPAVDKPRPTDQAKPDALGVQPFLAIAGLLLLAGTVAAIALPRRRRSRHRELAGIAAAAAICLVIGETLARSAVIDRLAGQLAQPLPPDHKVTDYVHVGGGFWASLGLTLVALAGFTGAAIRSRRRPP